MIPTAPPPPHHTSTAPPSSITTPPPPWLHHHQSPHHHHYTTTKMLLPFIIHITQLENPDLFQQACSHWWTQRNSWTQTPPINPNHNRKKKRKKEKEKPSSTPIKTHTPLPLVSSIVDQPRSTTKIPPEQKQRLRWSTQINHQNPTETKTHTAPINPDHNRKKKKTPDQPRSTPDTAAARWVFPPFLINPDQLPKSHRNKNRDIADQPRSQQEKKKKRKKTQINAQTPPPLD